MTETHPPDPVPGPDPDQDDRSDHDIAVIGMAGRFPGALDADELWENVRAGVESVHHWTDDELRANGVPESRIGDPSFVPANGPLPGYRLFDAEFFGLGPKEAAVMDPQHRQLLEVAWEVLEQAGYPPERFGGDIGVFAGCGMGAYFLYNVMRNADLVDSEGVFLLRHTGNDKDFLSTRISYALDLTGPSVNVQTACSTSLVAIHQACQSLVSFECDMALAGGVTIEIPHGNGYVFKEGEVLAPDGHCRAFDAQGRGTVFGSGAGMVALRRLGDAIDAGDRVLAVIRGSAVNNDGAGKISYMAPSVDGQAAAIAEALAVADVDPADVQYVETHGTGTAVGDPIEVAALNQAFGPASGPATIGIGSIKPNIGHLDTAAGIASFIKLVQALRHRELPPSINYEHPNPVIDFAAGPFYVNDRLRPWPESDRPAIGGVSSLGVGGTNAHVVVQQAPDVDPVHAPPPTRRGHLLVVSGRNREAVEGNSNRLADHLGSTDDALADIAWNLHATRRGFGHRRVVVSTDADDAIAQLRADPKAHAPVRERWTERGNVVFVFPGGGAHHAGMGRDLYDHEPVYRAHIDAGLARLRDRHDIDLAPALFPEPGAAAEADALLEPPHVQLPAIFLVEYALGKLYESYGITPRAMAGHSLGENTAACLAGVMSFEDCLDLVVVRGAMMEKAGDGGVLSVNLPADEVEPYLWGNLVVAGINGPSLTSVSGTVQEIAELTEKFDEAGIDARPIPFRYPVHSPLFDPHLGDFEARLRSMTLSPPSIPIVSNLTGTWLTPAEATDPQYWARQVRHRVRFAECASLLLRDEGTMLVEVGPGSTLSSFARQSEALQPGQPVLASMRRADADGVADDLFLLEVIGRLWAAGLALDPDVIHAGPRQRLALPTYAFVHREYFIEPSEPSVSGGGSAAVPLRRSDEIEDWFHRTVWREAPLGLDPPPIDPTRWLVFADGGGLGDEIAESLRAAGHEVCIVREGDRFATVDEAEFQLAPELGPIGYHALVDELVAREWIPERMVHLWSLSTVRRVRAGSSWFHHQQERGFLSLLHLAQAFGGSVPDAAMRWTVVTNGISAVRSPIEHPEKATVLGPVSVIPRELPTISVSLVDLDDGRSSAERGYAVELLDRLRARLDGPRDDHGPSPREQLFADLLAGDRNEVVAYRNGRRFRRGYDRVALDQGRSGLLRDGGTYLVTGGLGGIGMFLADRLARRWRANLILVGRSPMPERDEWTHWLESHGPDNVTSRRIRRLQSLEDAGAAVMVAEADVADIARMQEVVADAIDRFGAIDGAIHAAGVVEDALLAMKSESDIDRVLTPKVQGLQVLERVLAPHRPAFLVAFSSTSAALGLPGQVDYAAANAFVDAWAQRPRRSGDPTRISLAWGPWREIGMAADQAAELVDAGSFSPSSHPLLDYVAVADTVAVATTELDARQLWVLDEHRTNQRRAVLPGTGHVELLLAAGCAVVDEPVEIRDLTFVSPLVVDDDARRNARVLLTAGDGNRWRASLQSSALGASSGWQDHSSAIVATSTEGRVEPVDLDGIADRCTAGTDVDDLGIATRQEDHIRFGPRWRCLRSIRWGEGEALGELVLPDAFAADVDEHLVHAALLDIGTGFGLPLIPEYAALDDPPLYVPFGYGRLTLHAPLTQRVWSHLRLRSATANGAMARFDITFVDATGAVLVDIEDFAVARTESADFGEVEPQAVAAIGTDLAPEVLFERLLAAGIEPDDGWDAFERVLEAKDLPHVLVSPLPVAGQIALVTKAMATSSRSASFARPELASDYEPPTDETEAALVDMWEQLLGVDPVGIHDDFFELGGHSLIALRLFAAIKARFGVEHTMAVLFDAPTVASLADTLRVAEAGDGVVADRPVVRTAGLHHVVEMSPDPGMGHAPFFLVAGMFGNILNLRHLAILLGGERAVYGIQALGLREGEQPHRRFEDMAEAYIAEVRQVQPHGPYLLGGFSGGGITAFEMAHQLEAAGEKVATVVMLDSPRPGLGGDFTRVDKLLRHAQDLRRYRHHYPIRWARNRVEWERQKRHMVKVEATSISVDPTSVVEAAFYEAVASYRTRYWSGNVHLYRPPLNPTYKVSGDRYINADYEFQLPDNGWEQFAGDLHVHEIPGDHDSMVLEPNVRVLSAKIVEHLRQAEAPADPG